MLAIGQAVFAKGLPAYVERWTKARQANGRWGDAVIVRLAGDEPGQTWLVFPADIKEG